VGDPNITITRPAFGANPSVTYDNVSLNCTAKINTKLNIQYNPYRRTVLARTPAVISAAVDRLNFNWDGATNSIVSVASGGDSAMAVGRTIDLELNGGYIVCVPNLSAGQMTWGLSFEGISTQIVNNYQTVSTYPHSIIDIGIEYSIDTDSGNHVYRLIDGQIVNNVYTGANAASFYSPNFKPSQALCTYTNNSDAFAIACRRGNIINGSYEYIFDILVGINVDNEITTYQTIYTAKRTLNSSAIDLAPIFLSSENQAGNSFNNIAYILKGIDTQRQGNTKFNFDYSFSNTVKIQPILNDRNQEQINFWSALGLHSYHQTAGGQLNQSTMVVSYDGTPNNKTIEWETDFKDQDNTNTNESYFWIGKRKLADFYYFDTVTETWRVNVNNALAYLPKLLNVYLLNMTLKNYSGSYNNYSNINAAIDTTTGEDRLVGTIPLVIEDTTVASEVAIQYEVYNAYYRPLNNADNFQVNEFIVEISYKDFNTDVRKIINDINGILKLELNIKRGAPPNIKKIMGQQGIMPII